MLLRRQPETVGRNSRSPRRRRGSGTRAPAAVWRASRVRSPWSRISSDTAGRSRIRASSDTLLRLEAVSRLSYRENVSGLHGILSELFAQLRHMDVDRARAHVGLIAPDFREQFVARRYSAAAVDEREQ